MTTKDLTIAAVTAVAGLGFLIAAVGVDTFFKGVGAVAVAVAVLGLVVGFIARGEAK